MSISALPTGTIIEFGGSVIPDGFLPCDGAAISRTVYADLFAVTSTIFGPGNGLTTFNVPDCRGRSAIGIGTGTYSGTVTLRSLGDAGGVEEHSLTIAEMPVHNHGLSVGSLAATNLGSGGTVGVDVNTNRGNGDAHPNMHPYIAVNKIIKT